MAGETKYARVMCVYVYTCVWCTKEDDEINENDGKLNLSWIEPINIEKRFFFTGRNRDKN